MNAETKPRSSLTHALDILWYTVNTTVNINSQTTPTIDLLSAGYSCLFKYCAGYRQRKNRAMLVVMCNSTIIMFQCHLEIFICVHVEAVDTSSQALPIDQHMLSRWKTHVYLIMAV